MITTKRRTSNRDAGVDLADLRAPDAGTDTFFEVATTANPSRPSSSAFPAWVLPWFGLLMLAFAYLSLSQPTGWLGSDDAGYYAAAEYITSGTTIARAHHHYSRLAVSLPIALSISIFGHHTWSIILPTFLCSIGCLIVVALMGRIIWGWAVGLLAATLLLAIPYYTVLSTAAYPDVIACFWCALSMYLAVKSARAVSQRTAMVLATLTGLTFVIALSAKILVAPMLAAILYVTCSDRSTPSQLWWKTGAAVLLGVGIGLLFESAIFAVVADDPLFRWRSLLATHSNTSPAATGTASGILSGQLILDRLLMTTRRGLSGWGWIGLTFWPVFILAVLMSRRARPLALWAILSFAALAFAPLSLDDGWRTFPNFHGRHLLPCVMPLALCLAWLILKIPTGARRLLGLRYAARIPENLSALARVLGIAGVVLLVGFINVQTRGDISGFADRETRRVGKSVKLMMNRDCFRHDVPIFMTPSMYWRYRLLFSSDLRARLRVAVDSTAPDWWKNACVDMTDRVQPLPTPEGAYLLATFGQVTGAPAFWDYGVTLPGDSMSAWQTKPGFQWVYYLPQKDIDELFVSRPNIRDSEFKDESILTLQGPGIGGETR